MDTITSDAKLPIRLLAEPPAVGALPTNAGIPAEPLDPVETPKVRTKLRLYAILSGLYVSSPDHPGHDKRLTISRSSLSS